jgi:hypothetical protein
MTGPARDREVWFSLGENHEKAYRFPNFHPLRNCFRAPPGLRSKTGQVVSDAQGQEFSPDHYGFGKPFRLPRTTR